MRIVGVNARAMPTAASTTMASTPVTSTATTASTTAARRSRSTAAGDTPDATPAISTGSSSPRATSGFRPRAIGRLHAHRRRVGVRCTAITLAAQETSGPALTADAANNLYYQSGWVRGTFPADLSASDLSGVCAMQTTVNGQAISSYSDPSRDTSQWSQCHGSRINASVDTTRYSDGAGALTLAYSATNAAGAAEPRPRAINVDNVAPSVSLSAPADTASASGTQDVTVTGLGGPQRRGRDLLFGRRGADPDLLGRQARRSRWWASARTRSPAMAATTR